MIQAQARIRCGAVATGGALLVGLVFALVQPSAASAAPLSCSGTATNAVGAHAGSLSIRVGVTLQCDEAAQLEFVLPGGARNTFDTDATGAFTGIAGDAYVCSSHPQPVAVLATTASGEWRGLLAIEPEEGSPPGTPSPGPECDMMLHPSFNYVTYGGSLVSPAEAFASERFSSVLPFDGSDSLDGASHILAVFELVPGVTPSDWKWIQWRPLAPAFVNQLHMLVPGHSYVVMTDAELAWSYPVSTEVIHFVPAHPAASTTQQGSCFSSSLAAFGRSDAWRCSVGNAISDPCFSLDAQTLVCGADPSTGALGFLLDLTDPLPAPEVPPTAVESAKVNGWLIRLADGTVCNWATGATGGVDDKRANYACADQRWILGDLIPGDVWTADIVTISVGSDGWHADTRETVDVAVVWQ